MHTAQRPLHVAAHGLRLALPPRWESRIYLREAPPAELPDDDEERPTVLRRLAHPAGHGWPGESPNPVLHAATFALPPRRGDFGTGAVERMGPPDAFVALVEYDRDEAGTALFAERGLPRPGAREFAGNALQRRIPGQLGCQRFCTEAGRPFCLYVVLGSRQHRDPLVAQVHELLDGLQVGIR